MRKYEAMLVVRPDLDEEPAKEVVEKYQNLITKNGGEIVNVDEMGKRRLAYEIEGYNEGNYFVMYFQSEPSLVAELERVLRISDDVIRFLVIKDVR